MPGISFGPVAKSFDEDLAIRSASNNSANDAIVHFSYVSVGTLIQGSMVVTLTTDDVSLVEIAVEAPEAWATQRGDRAALFLGLDSSVAPGLIRENPFDPTELVISFTPNVPGFQYANFPFAYTFDPDYVPTPPALTITLTGETFQGETPDSSGSVQLWLYTGNPGTEGTSGFEYAGVSTGTRGASTFTLDGYAPLTDGLYLAVWLHVGGAGFTASAPVSITSGVPAGPITITRS